MAATPTMPDRSNDQPRPARPTEATLSVTRTARILGVHPNTVRAWSDRGLLRHFRINARGDRRFRLADLERFLVETQRGIRAGGDGRLADAPGQGGTTAPAASPLAASVGDAPRHRAAREASGGARADPLAHLPVAAADPVFEAERRRVEFDLIARVGAAAAEAASPGRLTAALRTMREGLGLGLVAVWERGPEGFVARAAAGGAPAGPIDEDHRLLATALKSGLASFPGPGIEAIVGLGEELAVVIPAGGNPPPILWLASDDPLAQVPRPDFALSLAGMVGALVGGERAEADARRALQSTDALRRIALDLGGRLDLDQVLDALIDHALTFFGANRGAIYLPRGVPGRFEVGVARGLSAAYLALASDPGRSSLVAEALAARALRASPDVRSDAKEAALRSAAVQEGIVSRAVVPLIDRGVTLGLLDLYPETGRPLSNADLGAFAEHASVAIRTARDYGQMARWTAQLASIQQLGARLSRLASVREIGEAIVSGLSELIDHHNVRVYRRYGEDLIPIAMRGRVGEYVDETPDQLRTKVGLGLTGWVAEHRVPQIVGDAAHDPRALTIPGTDADLDESMLLAPMLHEDDVLGVLVLSKLGLHQFTDDDLRLLVIYASFAAQAMASADATERLRAQSAALERQLLGQRELLRITESILTTLDPRAVLDQVADGLAAIIGYDRITIAVADRRTDALQPLAAKGLPTGEVASWDPEAERLARLVLAENAPRLVDVAVSPGPSAEGDAVPGADPSGAAAARGASTGSGGGATSGPGATQVRSQIIAPLRGRTGAMGVLMLERFGARGYRPDEFELVKVFAAQVSIALQNAEAHRAVAIRAQTDALTGLLNRGTFVEELDRLVAAGEPFGLIMLDLDGFKSVNDALGHQAGDRCLVGIAAALLGASRETDRVFRYGGDEFAVILQGVDKAGALGAAGRIRDAILAVGGADSEWARAGLVVSCSIGVATFPTDGATADDILLAADRACFVAKRSGEGLIVTAAEGRALGGELALQVPTPVDPPSLSVG